MSGRPTWEECAAAGMTAKEAAQARGCTVAAAYMAERTGSVRFRRLTQDEVSAAIKAMHADPEFAERNRERNRERMKAMNADPARNPLAALTETERADYDLLRRNGGMSRRDALLAIKRPGLVGE